MQTRIPKKPVFKKSIKCKNFPQSVHVDTILAKRLLEAEGYPYIKLENPILYRGDERPPNIIFEQGFHRKSGKGHSPKISASREALSCVSTTKQLVYAVGFADCPRGKFPDSEQKKEFSWVYLLYAPLGIDLCDEGTYGKVKGFYNAAKLVKEVTLVSVKPESILAAFQIRTTPNEINDYIISRSHNKRYVNNRIIVTDYAINENCFLKEANEEFYHTTIENFFGETKIKGYYQIPWRHFPEDDYYLLTYSLRSWRKKALIKYGFTLHQLKLLPNSYRARTAAALKAGFTEEMSRCDWFRSSHIYAMQEGFSMDEVRELKSSQVNGVRLGFPKEATQAKWFSDDHVEAARRGIPIEKLLGLDFKKLSKVEAFALKEGLILENVKELTSIWQIKGLLIGFTKEDVIAKWFSATHVNACAEGIDINWLRGKNQYEASASRQKEIPVEDRLGLTSWDQIDGLRAGFSKRDVHSEWFSRFHIDARKDKKISIESLRNKTSLEALGLIKGLKLTNVVGLTANIQVEGLAAGFSYEDVLSAWFDKKALAAASKKPIATIRWENINKNSLSSQPQQEGPTGSKLSQKNLFSKPHLGCNNFLTPLQSSLLKKFLGFKNI